LQKFRNKELTEYFERIREEFKRLYKIASLARSVGIDPEEYVEIRPAQDLAERVEGLLGIRGLSKKIRKLRKEGVSKEVIAFKVTRELIEELKNKKEREVVAETAIRTALAILTDGITAAPLQGIAYVKIKRNKDGSEYLAVYYAGPIRSAGGTEQALSVLVSDYVRQLLGLSKYKPLPEEIERFIEELRTYERHVGRFQYHASDDELRLVLQNIPIEVTGVPTDPVEVMTHRDLERIETNKVRGGALRVINDGIVAKARKLKPIIEELGIKGWEWVDKLIKEDNKGNEAHIEPSDKYLADVVAGRPIFSHPSRYSGFRIRYGRSRNTGLAAIGMNPATMVVLGGFLAVGTQVRTERPGKSAIIMPVDTIEGPIVKLKDGSVMQVNNVELAHKIYKDIVEIIYNGDVLVAYGEFKENNYPLVPSGYTEEWWVSDVSKALNEKEDIKLSISKERLEEILRSPLNVKPTAEEALELSLKLNVPLHPKFTYLWENVNIKDVVYLSRELKKKGIVVKEDNSSYIKVKLSKKGKRVLELLGIPHIVKDGFIIIKEHAPIMEALFIRSLEMPGEWKNVREYLQATSGVPLRDKISLGMGLRMGRPEKAAPREMNPPVHALFPIGENRGRSRSLIKALEKGRIKITVANIRCPKCGRYLLEYKCPSCNERGIIVNICPKCGLVSDRDVCKQCNVKTQPYAVREYDLRSYVKRLERRYGIKIPKEVKCVKGLTNDMKLMEPLIKGILRAKYGVYVFKDGTIRFDATNAPLTHFKPHEVGLTIEELRKLGYKYDYEGKPLKSEDQIVELKVQDIILPKSAGEYLLRVANFVDELLERVYGLEPYYKARTMKDLIGHLVIGIAPHTSAGIIGRILGFTEAKVIFAHPYWHAAKRRNCDGDEDAVILGLDALINFSKRYLPSQRGGMMDAPLVLTVILDPSEVDDEVYNMDTHSGYPREFYIATLSASSPKEIKKYLKIELVEDRLNDERKYYGIKFTHDTSRIDLGPKTTTYKLLKTMKDKIRAQLELAEKIHAVDANDVAERILTHHLLPDVIGNLRAFASQSFRCINCNTSFRRPPLGGKCPKCSGKVVLTVQEGSVKKYINYVEEVSEKYKINNYIRQRILLLNTMLKAIFGSKKQSEVLDRYIS